MGKGKEEEGLINGNQDKGGRAGKYLDINDVADSRDSHHVPDRGE
jgi:hypothetical protein